MARAREISAPRSKTGKQIGFWTPHQPHGASETVLTSLFQPDALLPAQYAEVFYKKALSGPEKKLMLAVLEDGLAGFQKYVFSHTRNGRRLFQEAEQWITEEDSDWVFSFENICDGLGLNPEYFREVSLRWKRTQLAKLSKANVFRSKVRRMPKRRAGLRIGQRAHRLQKVAG